jgi:hypothetical protein
MSVSERIALELQRWPGVTVAPHRYGGVEFRAYGRQIGHLHGDRLADLPFPRTVRDELIAAGLAQPHHALPDTGWVSFRMGAPEDAWEAIGLFRLSYDRIVALAASAAARGTATSPVTGLAVSSRAEAGK